MDVEYRATGQPPLHPSQQGGPSAKRQARELLHLEGIRYNAPLLAVLSVELRGQIEQLNNGIFTLYAHIKSNSPRNTPQWAKEPNITCDMVNGSNHRVLITCKPWSVYLGYFQLVAAFVNLENNYPHFLVRAFMPVVNPVTGKLAPEPSLQIVLCDLASRKGTPRGDYAKLSEPFLTDRDATQIGSLADQVDKDNATKIVKLVRSFAIQTQQALLGIYNVPQDQQTYELRFYGYKADVHYAHFLAIAALNEKLRSPIILKSLGLKWSPTDQLRYLTMHVSRNESMVMLHRTHPPVGRPMLINTAPTVKMQVDWGSVMEMNAVSGDEEDEDA